MREGRNQYAPMAGMPELRQAIVDKVAALYGTRFDVESEVTVTAGATQAIFTAVAAFVRPGDEVIVFEPVYDSYVPAIETVGGTAVFAQLKYPDYAPDWAQVAQLISPKTRLIIINSPHNPTGSLLSADDLDQLAALLRGTDIVVLSDEVYEHILFDGEQHASLCGHPQGASIQCLYSAYPFATGFGRLHAGCVTPSWAGSVLSGKARFLPRVNGRNPIQVVALSRHLFSTGQLCRPF